MGGMALEAYLSFPALLPWHSQIFESFTLEALTLLESLRFVFCVCVLVLSKMK